MNGDGAAGDGVQGRSVVVGGEGWVAPRSVGRVGPVRVTLSGSPIRAQVAHPVGPATANCVVDKSATRQTGRHG